MNLLGTLDRDGNADSNRSGGKILLGQIVPGNFVGNAALYFYMAPRNTTLQAPSSGLLLIQPQLLQLITLRSSGYYE